MAIGCLPAEEENARETVQLIRAEERRATSRPGQPAEIAPLYVLLADPASPFTSGDIFGSTGGKPQG